MDIMLWTSEKFPEYEDRTDPHCHVVHTFSISQCYQFISTVTAKNSWITGPVILRLDNLSHPTLKWTRIPISHVCPFLFCLFFFCYFLCGRRLVYTLPGVVSWPNSKNHRTGSPTLQWLSSWEKDRRRSVHRTRFHGYRCCKFPIRPWAHDCDRFLRVILS